VTLYKTDEDHNNHIKPVVRGIPDDIRAAIDQIFKDFQKPNQIIQKLETNFPDRELPNWFQIRNYIQYEKIKAGSKTSMNLGELEQWCQAKSEIPSATELDKVHVRHFTGTSLNPKTKKIEPEFFVWITTRRLTKLCQHTTHICADTTYKLVYQGYPVLMAGTTDRKKSFHPLGIAICAHERNTAYQFIFDSIKGCAKDFDEFHYQPNTLIADASDATTIGFKSVFGATALQKRVMCWFHMKKAYEGSTTQSGSPFKAIKRSIRQRI
jgi:hypothetical protein